MKHLVSWLVAVLLLLVSVKGESQSNSHGASTNSKRSLVKAYPRGATPFVELQCSPLDGRIVLRLPEPISDMDHRLVYSETNLKQVTWANESRGIVSSNWRQDGLAAYHLSAQSEQDGLLITWTITNLQPHAWSSSAGTVCMQSQGVPALYDPSGALSCAEGADGSRSKRRGAVREATGTCRPARDRWESCNFTWVLGLEDQRFSPRRSPYGDPVGGWELGSGPGLAPGALSNC